MGSIPLICSMSSASSRSRPHERVSSCSRTNASAVDLRKLLRLEKGAFLNKPAAHGEVPFCKRTIITRTEQSYGRVPLAGLCRLFISVYVPGAGLPGARASAFPAPHGSEICPDRAAYSAPAIDTHKAQCRWPWPFPPANTQWHWIPLP